MENVPDEIGIVEGSREKGKRRGELRDREGEKGRPSFPTPAFLQRRGAFSSLCHPLLVLVGYSVYPVPGCSSSLSASSAFPS